MRQVIISQMKEHDSEVKQARDAQLLSDLFASHAYKHSQTIATYLAFGHEFNTVPLIEQALKDGKRILVPKTYPKGRMIFIAYDKDQLAPTRFGLMEPISDEEVPKSDIDLIHVPGVAFNESGHRIGYGAGYYDRYLSDFMGRTVSTIYDFQEQSFTPDPYDIPVQEVLRR